MKILIGLLATMALVAPQTSHGRVSVPVARTPVTQARVSTPKASPPQKPVSRSHNQRNSNLPLYVALAASLNQKPKCPKGYTYNPPLENCKLEK